MNNNHIEHAAQIYTTRGAVSADQLKDLNASTKRVIDTAVKESPKTCPLRKGAACVDGRCALYVSGQCAVVPVVQHVISTQGKTCPLSGLKCDAHCTAFNGKGCAFAAGGIP